MSQIFHDPNNRRWPRFIRWAISITLITSAILASFIVTILLNPDLPNLNLLPISSKLAISGSKVRSHHQLAPKAINHGSQSYLDHAKLSSFSTQPQQTNSHSEIIGYYVNWDDNSFRSLEENIWNLDKLIPEWLQISGIDGSIYINDLEKQAQTLTFIQSHRPNLKVVPLINNYDSKTQTWNGELLAQLLASPTASRQLINNLLDFVLSNHLAGINIDFERVPFESRENLVLFMSELYQSFHSRGLEVSQSIPPAEDKSPFDYPSLVKYNDYIILMVYDEHYSGSAPGAVASQSWYTDNLCNSLAVVPANKCFISIGNYAYDWPDNQSSSQSLSYEEVIKQGKDFQGKISFDPIALNPYLDYYNAQNQLHHIWFLDAITAFNQIVAGQNYGCQGYAVWRLGSEDPALWKVLSHTKNLHLGMTEELKKDLTDIPFHQKFAAKGKGEILKVTTSPEDGKREIVYDRKSGLIIQENVIAYPTSAQVSLWGGEQKNHRKIALTFDDGPNDLYTSKILDILEDYHVPGTFFILGNNAKSYPKLLNRIVQEGHEIGNHTWTHPHLNNVSLEEVNIQLNITQRFFAKELGIYSLLFRPPYGEGTEPVTLKDFNLLDFISKLGYYTVGMQIDPSDWHEKDIDKIVNTTIQQAVSGVGNVVLLHDNQSSSDRTVAALPRIIQGLQARGFELVSVSNLLGFNRRDVMPTVPKHEQLLIAIYGIDFSSLDFISTFIYYLIIIGTAIAIARFIFIHLFALYEFKRNPDTTTELVYFPKVSLVVPAFNEEKVILRTINSLLNSIYPNIQIIIVDDSSTDRTYDCVVDTFSHLPNVMIFTKHNGGKAEALNYGIHKSLAEIIITIDADTILLPNSISKLVQHFVNPHVAAVAGNVKVGNRINLLTYWQANEYITTQNIERRVFGLFNCITVVPGAIGAWRRELVLKAGGFSNDTLAEDADLTLKILRMGYKVNYELNAIALTEAPDTIRGFIKQRFRWMYGTLQLVWKHRDAIFHPEYGALVFLAIPNLILSKIGLILISLIIDIQLLFILGWITFAPKLSINQTYSEDFFHKVIIYFIVFTSLDILSSLLALLLEPREDLRLPILIPLQQLIYRQLISYVVVKTLLTALQGTLVKWSKNERKATVRNL